MRRELAQQCAGLTKEGERCDRRNPRPDAPSDWACPWHRKDNPQPRARPRVSDTSRDDELLPHSTVTRGEHKASLRFPAGHRFAGQIKAQAVEANFEWFVSESAKIAVDMELGTWLDPETGKLWEGGRYGRGRIGEAMGFPNSRFSQPSFMEEPRFTRAVQWERIRREADMRMSSQTVKPLVSVAASAMITELLNRMLNKPESVKDRELIVETRKYVELLVSWDEGTKDKPHIQQTLTVLFQNINGLPASSRAKVRSMLGRELERGMDALRQLTANVGDEVSA